MKKACLALAAVAALGFSSAAFAEEGKKPAPMTDSEMDGVTAAGVPFDPGFGKGKALGHLNGGKALGTKSRPFPGKGPVPTKGRWAPSS